MAKWDRGKLIEGKYIFFDDLEYKNENWSYSTNKDRRFYTEVIKGLNHGEKPLKVNKMGKPPKIPPGTYDVGEGYYEPSKGMICTYEGQFLRELAPGEEEWITQKCRYKANKNEDPLALDGRDDEIIQEMIKLNGNPTLREARMKGLKQANNKDVSND